jgi:hypothetical protein
MQINNGISQSLYQMKDQTRKSKEEFFGSLKSETIIESNIVSNKTSKMPSPHINDKAKGPGMLTAGLKNQEKHARGVPEPNTPKDPSSTKSIRMPSGLSMVNKMPSSGSERPQSTKQQSLNKVKSSNYKGMGSMFNS